jgi:hypothetical protein
MREPIGMQSETARINEAWFSSYAAHGHDPNCADIYADLQSMYLLCKSMHMAGLAQSTSAHALTQATRDLCPSLEIIRGPAEHETTPQSTRRYVARQLLTQCSSHSFERRTKKKENIVHGAQCFLGAPLYEILPSLVRFGAPLPHAQHV